VAGRLTWFMWCTSLIGELASVERTVPCAGRVYPRRHWPRTALYGVSILRQLIETGDIAQRLVALEAQIAAPQGRNGVHRWPA
jgi:hypothetical protein